MDRMHNNKETLATHGWGQVIKDGHTVSGGRSQIAQIINELCVSANDPSLSNAIDELIGEVRLAFHRRRPGDQQAPPLDFTESPSEFLEALSDIPDNFREELIRSYETVWLHEAPDVYLINGEQKSVITKNSLYYQVDQIEEVARQYLQIPGARSLTLEWAIVNSLLYAESLAFIQYSAPFQNVLAGLGSLKGVSPRKLTMTTLWRVVKEGAKLLATSAFSFAVGQEDPTAVALIFLSITAARWFSPTRKRKQQEEVLVLAQAMMGTHRLAKHRMFNAGVVRHQAYHATSLGAVFSDYVYEILDRQILRIAAQAGGE